MWMVLSLLLDLLDLQELLLESRASPLLSERGAPFLCTFVLFMRQLVALDETRWRVGWMVLSLLLDLLDLQELLRSLEHPRATLGDPVVSSWQHSALDETRWREGWMDGPLSTP